MDTAQFLTNLRAQRDRIDSAITALEALGGTAVPEAAKPVAKAASATKPTATKRVMSPEARQRMAEAQKKRYAKAKRAVKAAAKKAAAVAPAVKTSAKTAPVASPASTGARKPMNEATKKKLAVAAKARWAAKKAPAVKKSATAATA